MMVAELWALGQRAIRAGWPDGYVGCTWWLELGIVAGVFAGLLAGFTRCVGVGGRLQQARREMMAAAYEMMMYRRNPRMIMRGEVGLVWSNLKYLVYLGPTIALGGVVFALLFEPMEERYGREPVKAGTGFIIHARDMGGGAWPARDGGIEVDEGDFAVEARVRVPALREVWARLRAKREGLLPVRVGGREVMVNVERPDWPRRAWWQWEDVQVGVTYPLKRGWGRYGWLVYFVGVGLGVMGWLARGWRIA